ncbi:ER membrane protein complex subunit 4-like [Halichondria panicea]|uniref:ER membrane protein complex subunit 4-like n=1 Tax=Halichondria panicea TaxID=6063 RepID=UPI00312B421F
MAHFKGRHKWSIDFSDIRRRSERGGGRSDLPSPLGYLDNPPRDDDSAESGDTALITRIGWSVALGPWKQLPLNLFIMWMAGNTISLFPIMMVGMMCVRPVQALMGIKDVYLKLKGDQAILQTIVFVLANLVGIGLGLYKFHSMGLLPTAQSDWLEFMEERQSLEISGGGFALT